MIQDETGNRSAQDRSDGYANHEERKGTRLFALGKPVREVQNESREIAGFSQPQHKARNVKLLHRMDEARQHGHKSPSKQDSGDPDARSDLVQQQIAGDFKKEVAKEENPENESELLAADGQRSEEHTSELQSLTNLVCRLLLEKKKTKNKINTLKL